MTESLPTQQLVEECLKRYLASQESMPRQATQGEIGLGVESLCIELSGRHTPNRGSIHQNM